MMDNENSAKSCLKFVFQTNELIYKPEHVMVNHII